jgi:membrane protein DedA with SNARE-associated domain/membrane-associated phospholipid phosphatase
MWRFSCGGGGLDVTPAILSESAVRTVDLRAEREEGQAVLGGITDWILSLSGGWALAVVFLGPALESSAFVGFVFPGELAVLLGGVLAYQGRVSLLAVVLAAVTGAIVGDTVGYWVGRTCGHQILRWVGHRIPFLEHRVDDHLEQARAYLQKRGGVAVLAGRFTTALRVMVPGLAGMADMHYPSFLAFNALGGALWGTAFVLLGYFAGAAWEHVAGYASEAGLTLLILVILGLVLTRAFRNLREGGDSAADRLAAFRPVRWFRRLCPRASRWMAERVDASTPRGFGFSFVFLIGVLCAWVFGGMTQDVVAHEESVRFDPGILRFAVDHRTAWLTIVMKAITWLGSNATLIPLTIVVCIWLIWRREARNLAIGVAVALAGANVLYHIAKDVVARPRPPIALQLVHVSGSSFPSGHATQALAGLGAIAIALCSRRSLKTRFVVVITATGLILLIGVSRIYLGVHWWTDVVGGFGLGGLWLSLVGAVLLWTSPRPETGEAADVRRHPVAA